LILYNGEMLPFFVLKSPKTPRSGPPAFILAGFAIFLAAVACSSLAAPQPVAQVILPSSPVATYTRTPASTATETPLPTRTSIPTAMPTPTEIPTATPVPTYVILRGQVLVRSNCRYGPGAPYLYKYGLVPGSNLEIIGRTDLGTWILVRAIGGNNPCWVKASLMDIKGDVMNVEPTYVPLPPSPYYGPPSGVSAQREGNEVHISWNPINLRAGDDQAAASYVVEAWVCQAGQLIFTPVGSYYPSATVLDEPGCSQPSHARLLGAEKHGYTRAVEIPWPQADIAGTSVPHLPFATEIPDEP
jgi:hypothetical protein